MKRGPKKTWILTADSTRTCKICGEVKAVDQFSPCLRGIFGVLAHCRSCQKVRRLKYYLANRERILASITAYRAANPEKVRRGKLAAMEKKPEYYRAKSAKWKKDNPERVNANERARMARRREELKPAHRAKRKRFYDKRRLDPAYRLSRAFSSAIHQSLREAKEGRSSRKLMPYSVEDLRIHLERQFLPGMNWQNYGSKWHLDHIVPKSKFSFQTPECEGFLACWALSNLRPLWKHDNMVKHARQTHLI